MSCHELADLLFGVLSIAAFAQPSDLLLQLAYFEADQLPAKHVPDDPSECRNGCDEQEFIHDLCAI